jgi:UDP:flavonoid glycosyltransferase YjiC (YdhE family)
MNFLAMTLGSIGDFFPFLAIAEELRRRGHRVVLASNAGYAALAQMTGFEFASLWDRSGQSLDGLIAQDPARAWAMVREQMFLPAMGPTQDCIARFTREGRWTLLASWSVLGAIHAHTERGLPICKFYLSPGSVDSDQDRCADQPGLCNIGLFPDWFAAVPGIAQTGFAMLGDDVIPPLSRELEAFLGAGPRPVIFTPGSFMRDAAAFFQQSLAACEQLGLRAVFLTPYREQVPTELPGYACHVQYAPLQRLAPRCAAIVHHGGIGTLAQGLKAGIPQLVTPLFFDQPDNAARLEALGVGESICPDACGARAITAKLRELLGSETVRQNCARVSALFGNQDGVAKVCAIAETTG